MPSAIVYCDRCAKLIPPGELAQGRAFVLEGGTLCAACVATLTPEQRAALGGAPAKQATVAQPPARVAHPRPASTREARRSTIIHAPQEAGRKRTTILVAGLAGGVFAGIAVALVATRREDPRAVPTPAEPAHAGPSVAIAPRQTPAPPPPTRSPAPRPDPGPDRSSATDRFATINSWRSPGLPRYAEIREALGSFPTDYPRTPEVAEAARLLEQIDGEYSGLADEALAAANAKARKLAGEGRRDEATGTLREVGDRFGEGPWLNSGGGRRIEDAVVALADVPVAEGPIKEKREPDDASAAPPAPAAPAASATPAPEDDITEGLVGWWRFDETGGDRAVDSSPSGAHGKLVNMRLPDASEQGMIGTAFRFDGSAGRVECGQPAVLSTYDAISVGAWVKPDDTDTHGHGDTVVAKEGGSQGFQLTWNYEGGSGRFGVMTDGATNNWGLSGKANGRWYHVFMTFAAGTVKLYVNGSQELSNGGSISPVPHDLRFGSFGGERFLRGAIDDVRIYRRALAPEEVWDLGSRAREGISAVAPTRAERALLFKDTSGRPAGTGFRLDMDGVLNLVARHDPAKVTPKRLATMGGKLAASPAFDALLRARLPKGNGYSFTRSFSQRGGMVSAGRGLEGRLGREKPEVVRICFDATEFARGRAAGDIGADLADIVEAVLERGAVPVLFTMPVPASTGSKDLDSFVEQYNAVVSGVARQMRVPLVDAFAVLNAEAPGRSKPFSSSGALKRAGADSINESFLTLYRVLERWVFARERKDPAPAADGDAAPAPERDAAPPASGGLVPNGSFEEMDEDGRFAEGWRPGQWGKRGAQCSIRIDRTNPRGGARALVLRGLAAGAMPGASVSLKLEPGKYELRFWASAEPGKTAEVAASLAGADGPRFTVTAGENWKAFAHTFEIEKRTLRSELRLWTSAVGGRVWIDDVALSPTR